MRMKAARLALLFALSFFCAGAGLQAAQGADSPALQLPHPHTVVALFLMAVDRGELVVFERRLERSMITPRRVQYDFDLDSAEPVVKVYAELRRPIAVPGHSDCEVRAVLATLDADGSIVDVEVHVWQPPKLRSGAPPAEPRASGGALACR